MDISAYLCGSIYLRVLFRAFSGLSLALLIGIPVGLLMGYNRIVGAVLTPIFSVLRPIPAIAFIPLAVLYFGIGEESKIALIFFSSFLYLILSTEAGVRQVPDVLRMVAQNYGASERQLLLKVILPAAMPHIFTGIKTATALSWALVVAAELVAAPRGLGFMVMDSATFFGSPMCTSVLL